MLQYLIDLLFPTKCLFCQKTMERSLIALCPTCWANAPEFTKSKNKISFVARWTCLWYYKDMARRSILRYKFYYRRSYAKTFGRLLAGKLQREGFDSFDLLTWVPVSPLRRIQRGFDQVEDLAKIVGQTMDCEPIPTLKKIRHNRQQSTLRDHSYRRANVLGAYQVLDPALIKGKKILLLDDILTSGSTASECARTLITAGAKEVTFAAIAFADYHNK